MSSSSAGRYHTRAPRYVLRPLDASLMRFAHMETRGLATPAEVIDLSETGLSFTLDGDELPETGEVLKIEFTVPGRKKIACFAHVIRVENQVHWDPKNGDSSMVKVAIRFCELPKGHHEALRKGLQSRTKNSSEDSAHETPVITPEKNPSQAQSTTPEATQSPDWKTAIKIGLALVGLIVIFHLMTVSFADLLQLIGAPR